MFMIIIIIGKDTISFMQDIYTYIPETNHVPKQYNVAILSLLFMIPISPAAALALMYSYFYISTFRSMCAVSNKAVFCSSLTSWVHGITVIIIIIIIIFFSFEHCRLYSVWLEWTAYLYTSSLLFHCYDYCQTTIWDKPSISISWRNHVALCMWIRIHAVFRPYKFSLVFAITARSRSV
jgi:hypothetical protein